MIKYGAGTALIVVDLQNDFADPAGRLYVAGGVDVVRSCNREIERARAAGAFVIFTQDWHPERTPHFKSFGGLWPDHCVAGTWGAEFHPELLRGPDEVIQKGDAGEDGYSGFSVRDVGSDHSRPTRLDGILRTNGVDRLVVVGLAGDYCVGATARDARALGYDVVVPPDRVAFVELAAGDTERTWRELAELGVRCESSDP
ncbi:MAG TPA: isochorismatase family protein [Candidatus Nitrosotalea sp.]|nr:isochorismatase family protein [Candidatus Nitrosotalea sp.]